MISVISENMTLFLIKIFVFVKDNILWKSVQNTYSPMNNHKAIT